MASTSRPLPSFHTLSDHPSFLPDCCVALSKSFLITLHTELKAAGGLVLSVGCGSGLLEMLLLDLGELNLVGVEIPSCPNLYLSPVHHIQVSDSYTLSDEALLATSIMFVYPRSSNLLQRYLAAYADAAMTTVVLICPKIEWPEFRDILSEYCSKYKVLTGPAFSNHEILAVFRVNGS